MVIYAIERIALRFMSSCRVVMTLIKEDYHWKCAAVYWLLLLLLLLTVLLLPLLLLRRRRHFEKMT